MFLLYNHADDAVDFPEISDHFRRFPKTSEDFQKWFQRPDKRF